MMARITADDLVITRNPAAEGSVGPVAVLLHGRGSNRHDLAQLAPGFPDDWTIVTPEAPHPGMPWGYGPGSAWYRYVEEDRVVGDTLTESLEALDGLLDRLPQIVGGDPSAVVLGGFSQGGTSSLAWAFTRPGRVAAVLNFSGFLVDDPAVEFTAESVGRTPAFWGHGTSDPAIPFALAQRGRARLDELGARLTTKDYRMGHGISPEELRDAVEWIVRVLDGSGPA
jgi:phospholipase/carboxylesterase